MLERRSTNLRCGLITLTIIFYVFKISGIASGFLLMTEDLKSRLLVLQGDDLTVLSGKGCANAMFFSA